MSDNRLQPISISMAIERLLWSLIFYIMAVFLMILIFPKFAGLIVASYFSFGVPVEILLSLIDYRQRKASHGSDT